MTFPTGGTEEVTNLLVAWSGGDRTALDKLLPLVENELHELAHRYMNRERPDHTLQTRALVNEAYMRLVDQKHVRWQNRAHFFAIAASIMRRILIDHARSASQGEPLTHYNAPSRYFRMAKTSAELLGSRSAPVQRLVQAAR